MEPDSNKYDFADFEAPPTVPELDEQPRKRNKVMGNTPDDQKSNVPLGFKPSLDHPMSVVRCTGIVRNGDRKGQQCNRWSIEGANVCLVHGGSLPNVRAAAEARVNELRRQIIADANQAVEALFDLLDGDGVENNVRLGAAKEIAALAGLKNGPDMTIEVQHTSPAEVISERLKQIRERKEEQDAVDDDVIDAEEDIDTPDES